MHPSEAKASKEDPKELVRPEGMAQPSSPVPIEILREHGYWVPGVIPPEGMAPPSTPVPAEILRQHGYVACVFPRDLFAPLHG